MIKKKSQILAMLLSLVILISLCPTTAMALSASTPSVTYPGQTISINVSGYAATSSSWVGFYKTGSEDNYYMAWSYISSLPGGVFSVTAPTELGTYNFRIFNDSGYTKNYTSDTVQVIQYTPTLTVNKSSFLPNEEIIVTYSGGSVISGAWIGFYNAESTDNYYRNWEYVSGTSGTFKVTATNEPGNYNVRLYLDSGYTKIGTSQNFTVSLFAPTLTVSSYQVKPSASVNVSHTNGPTNTGAWVGLYRTGAENNNYISWQYTGGTTAGTLNFTMPTDPGSYEFRIFNDSGFTKLASSQAVVVSAFSPTMTLSASNVVPGANVTVSYANGSTLSGAWIGLYRLGDADNSYISWQYTDSKTTGALNFTMPTTAGAYEFRFFNDSGYTRLTASGQVTVSASGTIVAPTPTPVVVSPTATPAPPEAFDAGVRLNWPSSGSNVLGYRLFRSTSAYEQGISVTDFYLTSTSFADVNVEPNTTYYYTVYPVLAEANPYQGIDELLGTAIGSYTVTTGSQVTAGAFKHFIMLQLDNPYLTKDGIKEEIDPGKGTSPMILSGRTVVPIRAIVEAMGGTVSWDATTRKITLNARGNTVEMWVDKKALLINGVAATMDVAPVISNGRTFVPVRFAAENLNCTVSWINSTKEAVIVYED